MYSTNASSMAVAGAWSYDSAGGRGLMTALILTANQVSEGGVQIIRHELLRLVGGVAKGRGRHGGFEDPPGEVFSG